MGAKDKAIEIRRNEETKCSCSESVWLAFIEGLKEQEVDFGNCLTEGFSGGLHAGSLCGAIASGVMVLGMHLGRKRGEERSEAVRDAAKALHDHFLTTFESVNCCDLKDEENHCEQYIGEAADFVEKYITIK